MAAVGTFCYIKYHCLMEWSRFILTQVIFYQLYVVLQKLCSCVSRTSVGQWNITYSTIVASSGFVPLPLFYNGLTWTARPTELKRYWFTSKWNDFWLVPVKFCRLLISVKSMRLNIFKTNNLDYMSFDLIQRLCHIIIHAFTTFQWRHKSRHSWPSGYGSSFLVILHGSTKVGIEAYLGPCSLTQLCFELTVSRSSFTSITSKAMAQSITTLVPLDL